MIYVQK